MAAPIVSSAAAGGKHVSKSHLSLWPGPVSDRLGRLCSLGQGHTETVEALYEGLTLSRGIPSATSVLLALLQDVQALTGCNSGFFVTLPS